jgi:hypothetical protein
MTRIKRIGAFTVAIVVLVAAGLGAWAYIEAGRMHTLRLKPVGEMSVRQRLEYACEAVRALNGASASVRRELADIYELTCGYLPKPAQ